MFIKKEHVLRNIEAIETAVTQVLESIPTIDFQESFEILTDRSER